MQKKPRTITIITPSGKNEVILRCGLSKKKRQDLLIHLTWLKDKFQAMHEIEDLYVASYVISVDGNKTKTTDSILNLRTSDFNFVLKQIQDIFLFDCKRGN